MWYSEISLSRILCVGPVLYPKEIYGIVSYLIFSMSFYITFKKKTLACGSQEGHMWVTSGLLCGSVGQVGGSASVTHFQPCYQPAVLVYNLMINHKSFLCAYPITDSEQLLEFSLH